ncbi:MAG: hypothetical protein Q8876_01450 [Bacillota bacterium]|nr:hypothetical protein [Bacillota bacterium]
MKKIIIFLGIIILIFNLGGCNVKSISLEQSQKNFVYYKNQLKTIVSAYHLKISELPTEKVEDGLYQSFLITINNTQNITVNLSNNASKDRKGCEDAEFIYKNTKNKKSFDLTLFIKIVNVLSGKEITKDYCAKFLSDPEGKHSPERYGIDKDENKKIFKYDFLNFGEDWSIGYSLYNDGTEDLTFWGLTKQLEN